MLESSNLTTPIFSQVGNSSASDWLNSHISKSNNQISSCNWNAISKCGLAALALLRNIAFTSLNAELPYATYTESFFAAGNIAALSGLDYWAGSQFIDYCLPQETGLEKVYPKETSLLQKAANVANFAPALLAQIPAVYAAIQYNKGSLRIPIGIVVFLGGAVIPLRSIQLSIENYFNKASAKEQGIDPLEQETFINLLKENRQNFINLSPEEKESFISRLEEIRQMPNPSEQIDAYLEYLLPIKEIKSQEELKGMAYGSTQVAKATGYALSGIYQYVNGVYTFVKTKENVLDNNALAGVMAPLVVGASLYLTGTAIVDSSVKLFHSITGINKEVYEAQETLAEKLRSKTMSRLHSLGHITNILALGVSYIIWKDFFKDETQRVFFESTMCAAVFLLLHASTPPVMNDFAEWVISHAGTPEEKNAIHVSQEYQTLIDSISRISPSDFQDFSNLLPETTLPPQQEGEISLHELPIDIESPLHDPNSQ